MIFLAKSSPRASRELITINEAARVVNLPARVRGRRDKAGALDAHPAGCYHNDLSPAILRSVFMPTKIFVADDVSDSGLEPLRAASFMIERRTGLAGDELRAAVADCEGLIVRSATKVTAELMDAAKNLRVIGRAGVGVDNIDVTAATARGVVVMNAPDGNTITTAEHTIALLVALARSVPQANSSLKAGKWERKNFVGTEFQGKTLGVIGFGRIGRVVAKRANALGMKVVAFDPFVVADSADRKSV